MYFARGLSFCQEEFKNEASKKELECSTISTRAQRRNRNNKYKLSFYSFFFILCPNTLLNFSSLGAITIWQ